MFNIMNFSESKTKNGVNLKLSAYVNDETEAGGHWENVYIYIPYLNNTNPAAQNPVTCKTDKDGNLFIRVPKARRYVPKEEQKPRPQMEAKPPKNEEKDNFSDCPFNA